MALIRSNGGSGGGSGTKCVTFSQSTNSGDNSITVNGITNITSVFAKLATVVCYTYYDGSGYSIAAGDASYNVSNVNGNTFTYHQSFGAYNTQFIVCGE